MAMALALVASSGCTVGDTTPRPGSENPDDRNDNPGGTDPTGEALHSILSGDVAPLPEFAGRAIAGRAMLVRTMAGVTRVDVQATGLTPNAEHSVHLHALPCAYAAGGHYKIDPLIQATAESNEIWPVFTSDDKGNGRGTVSAQHVARGDAMSVVIHDPAGGGKMACADLTAPAAGTVVATGIIAMFADALPEDAAIGGSAELAVGPGTDVVMALSGLVPDAEYVSHVHALPCDVNNAGGHYKIDPTVEEALEENELWPIITNVTGTAQVTFSSPLHAAREDAQSVVIHRVLGPDAKPKVACADLVRNAYPDHALQGTATRLPDAGARGYGALTAQATMTRGLDGVTRVSLDASGLKPDTTYTVHVHDLPCNVNNGGGHYKLDYTVTDVIESNEMWLTLAADASGDASDRIAIGHTARAEAQSLVIHDPDDGARLACIGL